MKRRATSISKPQGILSSLMAASCAVWMSSAALAHEFWIEPENYRVAAGENLVASVRVGEAFKGSGYSFNPRNFRGFDVITQGRMYPVEGRAGDRPAVNMPLKGDGLSIVVFESTDSRLTYGTMEKFENFLRHKDWQNLREEHTARGLPTEDFREIYSRYGKSLVSSGDAAGSDAKIGMQIEIVALKNPYTDDLDEMPVQVFYEDAPRANAQVELFEKAPDGAVEITLHRTDEEGIARFPVKAGHSYLVDSVVIRAVEALEAGDPVWESLWASLTFAVE